MNAHSATAHPHVADGMPIAAGATPAPALLAPARGTGRPETRESAGRTSRTRSHSIRSAGRWIVRGPVGAPRWERPSLLGLLAISAVLYIWNLAASGWANSFYSAAVQAGSQNWEAFFFGSSDAANSITVDKPPMSLWFMEISVRLFGLSSTSILLPQALMGVASVAVLYALVRRRFSAPFALLAGGMLAITPVAALMFRFNNPDALLVLLLTLATYFVMRGIESGRIRWVIWAGVMVGFAFLTKQLQGFIVLPAFAAVYLVVAPVRLRSRLLHLCAALGAVVVSAGWWVAIVELVPASMRPYVGGSQSNDFLQLTFGYNGFGRITGDETGSVTGGFGGTGTRAAGGGFGMWGATGVTRLFGSDIGGQISWLLPAALILLVVGLIVRGRAPRTDARRALLILLGATTLLTATVFSFAGGIFHPYYTIALAPGIAGMVAVGGALAWGARDRIWVRIALAATVAVTVAWSFALLSEASTWQPWIKWTVLVVGIVAVVLLLVPRLGRALSVVTVSAVLVATLLGPLAFTLQTVNTAHTGSIPSAGPTVAGAGFGRGGGFRPGVGGQNAFGGQRTGTGQGGAGAPGAQGGPGGTGAGGATGATGGTGANGAPGATGATGQRNGTAGRGGFGGGLLGSSTVSSSVVKLLLSHADSYTWVAATIGSNNASGYQLAAQKSVMPIGGFNGSDPSPTLAQFKADVAAGKIHYFIGGGVGRSNGGSDAASQIESWVEKKFSSRTVDGVTLYDLSSSTSSASA